MLYREEAREKCGTLTGRQQQKRRTRETEELAAMAHLFRVRQNNRRGEVVRADKGHGSVRIWLGLGLGSGLR